MIGIRPLCSAMPSVPRIQTARVLYDFGLYAFGVWVVKMGFGIPGVCGNETGLDARQVLGEWRI
jgi:hypothetical protein